MKYYTYEELREMNYNELKTYHNKLQDNGDEYDEGEIDMVGDMMHDLQFTPAINQIIKEAKFKAENGA